MASMTVSALHPQPGQLTAVVVGGIDTHRDLHMVAVVDGDGMVLGTESFSTTRAGYRALLRWMRGFGDLRRVGIEGTGSYGAGVTRHLADADVEVWRCQIFCVSSGYLFERRHCYDDVHQRERAGRAARAAAGVG